MRIAPDNFVLDDNSLDIVSPDPTLQKDDVDTLFDKLQALEPPQVLIARILELSKISPVLPLLASPTLRNPWEKFDALALCNAKRHPC